ncbi:MAG: MgtC/SapB family protein [Burkholderiales bacterium]|nr:MgtC/SapB family protein [Phycisphaerae bacterium]
MLLRMLLATACGGLVGLEREIRGRQAGFRTNILVCLGSAVVMIVSISLAEQHWKSPDTWGVQLTADPGRIAYGVMGGIGFLGAGTIIHSKGSIRGLTTAAALWCVAALGLGAGMGLYVITIMATVIVVLVLWLLNYIERAVPQTRYRFITLRVEWRQGCISDAINHVKSRGFRVLDASFNRSVDEKFAMVDMHLAFIQTDRYYSLERELEAANGSIQLMATRQMMQ